MAYLRLKWRGLVKIIGRSVDCDTEAVNCAVESENAKQIRDALSYVQQSFQFLNFPATEPRNLSPVQAFSATSSPSILAYHSSFTPHLPSVYLTTLYMHSTDYLSIGCCRLIRDIKWNGLFVEPCALQFKSETSKIFVPHLITVSQLLESDGFKPHSDHEWLI